jgi:DNA polymerase III subunit alpha
LSKFTHLHVHSHYSLLDGLAKVPDIVDRVKELGMGSVALTDHGSMYGILEFYKTAKKKDIKPILGCEVYIAPRKMEDKTPKIDGNPFHLVLLAKNKEGYLNLLQLVTLAHLEGYYYKPRVDKETLRKYSGGLIALSACLAGEIPRFLHLGEYEKAKKSLKEYVDIFGPEDFYLEMQDHPALKEQQIANKGLKKLAKEMGIGLVVTNDSHYITLEQREAHEALLCVQTGKFVSDKDRMSMADIDASIRSFDDMYKAFSDVPEAFENTLKIAEKCNVELDLGGMILPHFEVPKGYDSNVYLKELVQKGVIKKYGEIRPEIQERMDYEISVIQKMAYSDYFLIVSDYVTWAKNQGIVVGPGRGSAAGSLIAYALDITDLDPLKYGLLFERFLNPDRVSMPDIDMDFADDRRSEVIKYVTEKYGKDKVAQIITFGTMAARNAVRDTGRALGMSYSEVDRVAKLIEPTLPLTESVKVVPELKQIYNSEPEVKKLIDLASNLEGVCRHSSTHAAGVVISKDPLSCYCPLQKATKGDISVNTQYSMGPLEDLGLLKMDFLGLANLTILKNTLRIIRKVYDKEIDLAKISLEDKKTFELLSRGETTGVFQLESAGMKRYIKKLKPNTFEDIVAMVALYRPGPMQWIDDFIDRKHGKKKVEYAHPLAENALKNTYGVIVYQEQVMQISKDMAGFTGGEADTLRKAMGKKIADLMKKMRVQFIEGSVKNGVSEKVANSVFDAMEEFAAYAFNKSHAACYALIAYQTAYLKAHYPAAFMAALMTSNYNDQDKIAMEIEECRRMKIEVLPPDVNESFSEFGVVKETGKIRFGLKAIKNVGEGIIEAILDARAKGGKFKNIEDFARRVSSSHLNKKVLEALAKSGSLESLGVDMGQVIEYYDKITSYSQKIQNGESNGQMDLFGSSGIEISALELPPSQVKISGKQKLSWEKELLSVYISKHPIDEFQKYIDDSFTLIAELKDRVGQEVKVAGVITQVQRILTRNGQSMLFAKLEDRTGAIEVLVFPKIYLQTGDSWKEDKVVVVKGKINPKEDDLKLLADKVNPIEENLLATDFMPEEGEFVEIYIPEGLNGAILQKTKEILIENKGSTPVIVHVYKDGEPVKIKLPFGVTYSEKLEERITDLLGERTLEIAFK